ncbi:MAG: response regulator [Lachnospiraceae bacterium]|nr:response regulator [Lachnospiraceae bacterium]
MAKILVTDDAAFMRIMLGNMLREAGYEVCEAGNGWEMLEQYEKERPDLVTLDITMPELDGRGAIKLLREKEPKAKVIMCSAMGQRAMVLDAIQSGACDFIVKPFEKSKVLESVRRALAMNF